MTENMLTLKELRQLLQHRHEYSRVLLTLADAQSELIDQGEYSGLIELLVQKQTVLDAFHQSSQLSPSLREQWHAVRDQLEAGPRQECERWIAETEANLERLIASEQTSTEQMQVKRDQTRDQLQLVSAGLAAQDAYTDQEQGQQVDFSS